jgi:hypothetical protein
MAKPLLVEPADLRLYIIALAEGQSGSPGFGITQAWRYQRTFPEHSQTRGELIRMLLDWCFTRKSNSSAFHSYISQTPNSVRRRRPTIFGSGWCSQSSSVHTIYGF